MFDFYLQVATTIDVFVFDVLSLGPNCWDLGLKSIFEDPRLSKVNNFIINGSYSSSMILCFVLVALTIGIV